MGKAIFKTAYGANLLRGSLTFPAPQREAKREGQEAQVDEATESNDELDQDGEVRGDGTSGT